MRSESPHSEPPKLLVAFAPEYEQPHYHLHGRKIEEWESFKSIFLDEHYEFNKFSQKVLKGALLGLINGVLLRNFAIRGPKRFELDRLYMLNKYLFIKFRGSPNLTPLRGYVAFGAFLGAAWWAIKDVLVMPHGYDTFARVIIAHGLMGGVIVGTIVHPVNFLYGCAAGALVGGFVESTRHPNYPRNFELKVKSTN